MSTIDELPKHGTKKYKTRLLSDIKYIVIHHSATKNGSPLSFAKYHVESRNWPGIGYHYVIGKDGIIHKTNNLTTMSYHAGSCNRQGIGICLIGNFEEDRPTQEQYNALAKLTKELQKKYSWLIIKKHKDLTKTNCPGNNFDITYLQTLLQPKIYDELEKENAELKSKLEQIKKILGA